MKEKFVYFLKSNFIVWAFVAVAVIIELTGVCVTSGKFFIRNPLMFLSLLAIFVAVLFTVKNNEARYWCALSFMLVFFALDLVFIVVYDMTGSTFDYSMLDLRSDALAIVESIPLNFAYVFVTGISISLYMLFARYYLKVAPKPKRLIHPAVTATVMAAVLTLHGGMAYLENRKANPADLSYRLYSGTDGTYSDRGILGNFVDELYKGAFFSTVQLGDEKELEDYIYASQGKPSAYHGVAKDYNVITILGESFEWFSFMAELSVAGVNLPFPGGFNISEEQLRELYPNLYRLYDTSALGLNHHAREKTDISENQAIMGSYPTDCYVNYEYPENSVPYSLPNILSTLYGISSRSFHNGKYSFYNRPAQHENALGFGEFMGCEQMEELAGELDRPFTNYDKVRGDYNLDSEMINVCKEIMFPADHRFNTFITTLTMHGQNIWRDSLKIRGYYDKLFEYGIGVELADEDGHVDDLYSFVHYAAAALDFDKSLGIMFDYLENTLDGSGKPLLDKTMIVLFGDHNAYYGMLCNNVKEIYADDDSRNYTDLFRVPLMVYVGGGVTESMPESDRLITKFTDTCDILPTILDLFGINFYDGIYYGSTVFGDDESIIYSRAYNVFITDKLFFSSINNIRYRSPDADEKYIETVKEKALTLLDKTSHINRIFYYDFLAGERTNTFNTKLKELNA